VTFQCDRICLAKGCDRRVNCCDCCNLHYQRIRRFGNPHLHYSEMNRVPLQEFIAYTCDKCIIEPHFRVKAIMRRVGS
jgi:hypothetical protein